MRFLQNLGAPVSTIDCEETMTDNVLPTDGVSRARNDSVTITDDDEVVTDNSCKETFFEQNSENDAPQLNKVIYV